VSDLPSIENPHETPLVSDAVRASIDTLVEHLGALGSWDRAWCRRGCRTTLDPVSEVQIREYTPDDAEAVLALNEANRPAVGALDLAGLGALVEEAVWVPIVVLEGEVVGFAILLAEGAGYESPNYRWFCARHRSFLYVDRIAFGEGAQGRGLGSRLYALAVERARRHGRPMMCAEVNTLPPNPGSYRFHVRAGFVDVAHMRPYRPDSEVAMLERPVPK